MAVGRERWLEREREVRPLQIAESEGATTGMARVCTIISLCVCGWDG